jgi:uncharacterized protein (DUF302 family)
VSDLAVKESDLSYSETAARLEEAIKRRGLTLFARVDHAAGAAAAGMSLPPEEVFFFGNPQAGTPLMQADPKAGYELPLRILLWQAGDRVMIGYRDPRELAGDYALADKQPLLDRMAALLADLAAEASAAG